MGFTLGKRTYGRYERAYLAEMQWEIRLVDIARLEVHACSMCLSETFSQIMKFLFFQFSLHNIMQNEN